MEDTKLQFTLDVKPNGVRKKLPVYFEYTTEERAQEYRQEAIDYEFSRLDEDHEDYKNIATDYPPVNMFQVLEQDYKELYYTIVNTVQREYETDNIISLYTKQGHRVAPFRTDDAGIFWVGDLKTGDTLKITNYFE